MASLWVLRQRRLLCTQVSKATNAHHHNNNKQWKVKQVTKLNFEESLAELDSDINSSNFVAVSLKKTGSFSAAWHRISAFDSPETAYFKAKYAADRFQIFQFAVCPFTVSSSKVTAFPYNFHLFPRDELKTGMPSYSFSCQSSHLTSMAQQGFDFNACIYNGISYLSRSQESAAKVRMASPIPAIDVVKTTTNPSVADSVFISRVKSRVKHWKNTLKNLSAEKEDLVRSLRKLVLASEEFESRPCMNVDVCSQRQVELTVQMLRELGDDLLPLLVPARGGETLAVRVVLTSSKEDKDHLQKELLNREKEHYKKVRGFREVIDLISASQKPVVSHNSLNDLTFIHSKFVASLPVSVDEFMLSMRAAFPQFIDINQLMRDIGPLGTMKSIPKASLYLKNHHSAPFNMEISCEAPVNKSHNHGQNVVRVCELFAKLCHILKDSPNSQYDDEKNLASLLQAYSNVFSSSSKDPEDKLDTDVRIWTNNTRKVNCKDLVFLWGFGAGVTAGRLKSQLQESHQIFSAEFDVRLVDKSCAIVVFWQPGLAKTLLDIMNDDSKIQGPLREIVSEGLRATGYETYHRACSLGMWETNLAASLEKALSDSNILQGTDYDLKSEAYWDGDDLIVNLDDI